MSFQAPDGATGLVCPICRSPLRAPEGSGEINATPAKQVIDWAGGSLDDLVALLSAPAWSARVEVLPASGGNPVGEVQVIAGGVSDAIFEGKSTHESLDKLRAVPGAKYRIEPRLPNPANGDLAAPGPEQGKLEERPLATLMRYCEEFVLTAGIEVWRASENAKVEYKRGEIVGVTVGGIDAPERLAEVMKWASGSYRLVVPKLTIPETAPKAPAPPAVVAPRTMGAASKTIFGMPALDPAAIAAAADKARQAKSGGTAPSATILPPAPPAVAPSTTMPAAVVPPPPKIAPTPGRPTTLGQPVVPPPAAAAAPPPAAPQAQPAVRASTNRTIFGVAAPQQPAPTPATAMPPAAAPAATPPPAARPSAPGVSTPPRPATPTGSGSAARPTTAVSIPAVVETRPTPPPPAQAVEKAQAKAAPPAKKKNAPAAPVAGADDATLPTNARSKPSGTPVWTYVGVGFIFGLALLGVYRLVMVLAH
ncbi:MAG TPA: hypothetical protein VGP07_13540 [Polyangia bacterium]